METFLKQSHSFQQFLECRFLPKYHRRTHTFVIILPSSLYITTRDKHYAFAHIWSIIHTSNTCENLPMVSNGLPQFIIVDSI